MCTGSSVSVSLMQQKTADLDMICLGVDSNEVALTDSMFVLVTHTHYQ